MRPASWAAVALAGGLLLSAGCATARLANHDYNLGRKAQELQDYDTALVYYERALRADPSDVQYKLSVDSMRFQAAQAHVELGRRLMARGDLTDVETALGNFQRAHDIDPASAIADQMVQKALERIAELKKTAAPPPAEPGQKELEGLEAMPPQLKISNQTVNLTMTNDDRVVYDTIAKMAGLAVLFAPDLPQKSISVQLVNVTLEQALDAVAAESGTFWKPMTSSILFVATNMPQYRTQYQDEIVKTFYLRNATTPQDLTSVVGAIRQLLQLQRVSQINSLNAIVVRGTTDQVAAAQKIIDDVDQQQGEAMLQVSVLEVSRDRLRDLGITPGTSATVTFTPRTALQSPSSSSSSSSSTSSTTSGITLNNLKHLSTGDYSALLPGAAATALLTDSTTKIIQNPQILLTDGAKASLTIGEKVPTATGSFNAGIAAGITGAGTGALNPLFNTQFQYQDVGVVLKVTPTVHLGGDVSLDLDIQVSSVSNYQSIGGIQEPVISTREIQTDMRLADGQTEVLGGLIQNTTTKSVNGWPGFANIPFLKYFFSDQKVENQSDEVLIVLTPHVVRMPNITAENLRSLFTGSDQYIQVYPRTAPDDAGAKPVFPPGTAGGPNAGGAPASAPAQSAPAPAPATPAGAATLAFEPASLSLAPGATTTIALVAHDAADLYSIPLILHYDPKVIAVEDIRDGGFLSGGTQVVSIFHQEDPQKGQAIISATRPPNTAGVNGSGTLLGIVVKALAPGTSPLTIEGVGAKNSKQQALAFSTQPATITVTAGAR